MLKEITGFFNRQYAMLSAKSQFWCALTHFHFISSHQWFWWKQNIKRELQFEKNETHQFDSTMSSVRNEHLVLLQFVIATNGALPFISCKFSNVFDNCWSKSARMRSFFRAIIYFHALIFTHGYHHVCVCVCFVCFLSFLYFLSWSFDFFFVILFFVQPFCKFGSLSFFFSCKHQLLESVNIWYVIMI